MLKTRPPSTQLDESRDQTLNPFMAPTVADKRAPWLWRLVILLLALLALGQGAWLGRASLAQYSLGQQLLTALCSSLDCQVPQLRDPSQIQVVSREMAVTEDRPGVLVFLLLMKNGATFAQPWPYLELALCLTAGLDGIRRSLEPTEPTDVNIYHLAADERACRGIGSLPGSLEEALDEMERDQLVLDTLGDHVVSKYLAAKRAEWDSYRMTVTQWELDQYLLKY